MATKKINGQVFFEQFVEQIKIAAQRVQDNFALTNWPSDAPRFEVCEVEILYQPAMQCWHLQGMIKIFSAESPSPEFKRHHVRTVKEEIYLPDIPEDYDLIEPYLAALVAVLCSRVSEALREKERVR